MIRKVAYLVSTLRRTGPTNQLLYIIRNLDPEEFEAVVITLSPEPDDSMLPLFLDEGISLYTLNLGRLAGLVMGSYHLRRMLKDIQPAIIHTQGLRPDMLGLGLGEWPVVSTQRNDPFEDYPSKYGKLRGGLMAWQQMRVMHTGRNVYACSASLAQAFKEKYKLTLPYVSNGVDTNALQPADEASRLELRSRLGLPPDHPVLISVGSLIPRKNHAETVIAMQSIQTPITLVILGKGPEAAMLRAMEPDTGKLVMPGQVENVADYLKASDVFISASLGEGLPNTVLEALACGLPPLLSDIPPHREIMQGIDWPWFFPAGSGKDTLSEMLGRMMSAGTLVSSEEMHRIALSFSAERMSLAYQEIYYKLLR